MNKIIVLIMTVSLLLIFSGCMSPTPTPTPAPTATPAPTETPEATATPAATAPGTSVEVLSAPDRVVAGTRFEISWRVNSPVEKTITHTAVHYGPESKSEPLTLQSYPSLTQPQGGKIPADFKTNITVNTAGIIYFRAHAIIDAVNYWSPEMTIIVSAFQNVSQSVTPTINVTSYPASVQGEANFTIQWQVSGGTPGTISNTSIIWGFNSGGMNITDYPRTSAVKTGNSPGTFSADLKAPAGGGPVYFRAHAVVDGVNIYSPEQQITIVPLYTGGGGGGGGY